MQTRFHSAAHASFRTRFKFNRWARAIKRLSIKRLWSRRTILAEQSVYAFMMRAVCNDRYMYVQSTRMRQPWCKSKGESLWALDRISELNAQNYIHKGPQRLVIEWYYLIDRNYLVQNFLQDKHHIRISS